MPIVTVSRQYGSGGSEVAARIARTLGWALLDNAVIDAVASRTGLSVAEVAAREERMPSLVERVASAMTMSTQEMLAPLASAKLPPSDERLLDVTRRVIEEAAERGSVVIVGRGAQMTLGSRGDVFGIFCYAPVEALARRIMARDRLDHAAAVRRVREVNNQRAEWTRSHWGREWERMENYHLCVNTDLLGIDLAAEIAADAARRHFGAT